MIEKLEKYADVLLKRCLNLKINEPLFIESPVENYEFVRILNKKALEIGSRDIHIEWYDENIKHDSLLSLTKKEIEENPMWNKKIFDEYAKKNAAFLMLDSENPNLMTDVDSDKISHAGYISRKSRTIYKQKQGIYEVSWCIAATSTLGWSKKLFPNSNNSINELWNLIFDICFINEDDPIKEWEKQVNQSEEKSGKLNSYKFKELHYTNDLGTNLSVGLTPKTIWCGAGEKNLDGRSILVNIPTFEVFTSPDKTKTNGVVYSSKPLVYNGALIENFMIKFENGKVIDFKAEKGEDVLKGIIYADSNSCMLGEIALVDYDSKISKSGITFYTTLYDENASCHLALGDGFKGCLENGVKMNDKELQDIGLNHSVLHVDFMIGTNDLKIVGITNNNEEKVIFENGNYVLK